jgi:hypothetical protein
MKRDSLSIAALSLLVGACCVSGCSPKSQSQSAAAANHGKPPTLEQQVKSIQDNPRMSPQAKEAALNGMRMSFMQRGQQMPAALKP